MSDVRAFTAEDALDASGAWNFGGIEALGTGFSNGLRTGLQSSGATFRWIQFEIPPGSWVLTARVGQDQRSPAHDVLPIVSIVADDVTLWERTIGYDDVVEVAGLPVPPGVRMIEVQYRLAGAPGAAYLVFPTFGLQAAPAG